VGLVLVVGPEGEQRVAVPQDARGNVAAATNGNYEVWLEVIEDLLCCSLAEFVDLCEWAGWLVWSLSRSTPHRTYLVVGDVDLLDHVCDLVNPVVHTRIQNVRIE